MTIVFIGDIHQMWDRVERGLSRLATPPRAAVILGDVQCDKPLDALAAPLLRRGIAVHWIFGNHDNDGGPEMWHHLTSPAHNPVTSSGSLHATVTVIEGVRIAGLGGTFRPRIWEPPAPPRLRERSGLPDDVRQMGKGWRPEHIDALVHSLGTTAIWPEDYDLLASQRADILVTHEAPSSHPAGNNALDALARAMGARLIVHGHHHVNYLATSNDNLQALGVAAAWGVTDSGEVLWEGEAPRYLTPPPQDGPAKAGRRKAEASGPYAAAQDAASAIRLFQGKAWYDTTQDISYFPQRPRPAAADGHAEDRHQQRRPERAGCGFHQNLPVLRQ